MLLSTYILAHKEKFFDCRNKKLAMVGGDPLGEAFEVRAFHRCQVGHLLKQQLIPVQDKDKDSNPPPPPAFLPTVTGDNFTLGSSDDTVPLGSPSSSSTLELSSDDAFLQEFDVESSGPENVRPAQVGGCCYTTELD